MNTVTGDLYPTREDALKAGVGAEHLVMLDGPKGAIDKAAELCRAFEGCYLFAYDDAARKPKPVKPGQKIKGTLTIGWGHTGSDVHPGQIIDQDQAEVWLWADLVKARAAVEKLKVKLNENQTAALISFEFNSGGVSTGDDFRKVLKAGQLEDVPEQMMRWVHVDGEEWSGLIRRRKAEVALWYGEPWREPPPTAARTLRRGDRGIDVTWLTEALTKVGYMNGQSSTFGPKTQRAVRRLQEDHNLAPDGVVGPLTRKALAEALAEKASHP